MRTVSASQGDLAIRYFSIEKKSTSEDMVAHGLIAVPTDTSGKEAKPTLYISPEIPE